MIDFNKKIVNSDKFRNPALTFIATGEYCHYPKGTSEYYNFWETEADKCINGFTSDDGDYITGYNYFYLNYCPIQRIVYKRDKNDKLIKTRELSFPDFYDYDYYYFNSIQEAEQEGKHMVVAKARRKGYEQPYSEPVLTPNGYVPMGSLKVGDLVMNPNGIPVRIGDIVEQGTTEIYEVEFQDGRKVRCGANHLWATCRNGKKFYIIRTVDYMKRKLKQGSPGKEHYPYKIPELNPLKFDERPITVDPYVLGVLLGDGCICGDQVKFSTADQFIVEELQKRLPDYLIEHKEGYTYVIKSKIKGINELNRQLKELQVKVKSYDKFIPEDYKFSSIENRFELVRGLMDIDGSITNGACNFVSTSEKLIDDLTFILRSLGIRCKKSKETLGKQNVDFGNDNYSDIRSHWELIITTEEDIFKLPRKLEKVRKNRNYNYKGIGIKSIRKTGEFEQQRCLCIDNENHLYITKDFIPTHNSYKGGAMLCRNFFLIPGSKSYVYASNKQYLTDDGILTKAWDYMDFIDSNTAWGKKRQVANTQMRRRASMIVTDDFGNKIEVGYKSEIIGVSLKDNPDSGHPYSQIVYTPDGKKQWKDITVGSRLFAGDGTITKVSEVEELGEVDVYEFVLSDGRTVKSTADHKWEIIRKGYCRKGNKESKDWKIYELSTLDIHKLTMNKSYLSNPCKLNKQHSVQYPEKPLPIDPYTLGLLLGDGSIVKSTNSKVPITQLPEDMEEISKYIPYTIHKHNTRRNVDYVIDIPNCRDIFTELELIDKRSGDKFIPDIYKYNSENNRLSVLNGLLDTDGTISKDYGIIEFSSKSIRLIQDTAWLCRSLGINCKYTSREIKGTRYYRLYIYTVANDNRLFNLPRKKERLSLKKNNSFANSKRLHSYIVSSKIIGKEISKCVHVEHEDHMYQIGDFILTKNCRGKAGKLILWEEAGTFPELEAAWQIARPSVEQDGIAFGTMIMFGTGGDQGSAVAALRRAFYDPKSFNCLEFENIWDEGAQNRPCGFFVPQHTNLDIRDKEGNRLYMDKDGNTIHNKSRDFILGLRKQELENAVSSQQIDRYIAEHSETPAEAFTELSGNIFPKKELQKQLAKIRTNKKIQNHKQVGFLTEANGEMIWNIQKGGDITQYPLPKDTDPKGAIVIWEHPVKNAPFGLYIAGIDPYDHDQSGTNSLGSCIIYKRFQDFESYSDIIVAEYTGRPATAEIFYENVRKLLIYYNARAMVENQNTGIFTYFNNKHCSYLLADQPDIIKDIVNNSSVNRRKGCHMNKEIKLWGEGKIKEWLEEKRNDEQLGLNTILSEPLLEELIQYNDKINVDRIMAFMQVMIYKEQLYNTKVKQKEEEEKKIRLFDKPLFKFDHNNSFTFMPLNNNTTTFMFTN